MSPSAWPVVLLAAPLLIGLAGLAAAYPHRGYHDDVDGIEKNVRHIDGLGRARRDVAKDLEDAVRRQVEEQVRATGSGSASGKWSIQRHSEYSSDGSGVPVRATITGEAAQGGDGVVRLATDCHNCRMRIRKVGGGGVDQVGDSAQVQSTQSRYYSTSGNSQRGGYASGGSGYSGGSSGYTSGGSGYTSGGSGFSGGATSDRLVQSSRYGGFGETQQTQQPLRAQEAFDDLASSSRTRSSLTRASWKLSDLGYGTSDLAELVRRIDEDIRAGRFRDGKTVTTVTSSVSENGGPPVTKTETFVKDGLDLTQFPERGGAVGSTYTIGNSEVEDLLRGLQEQLRSGKTQAGKTVTTTVESSSINGAPPVVKKQTFVRDGFDASAVDLDAARERFEANSARLNAEAANIAGSGAKRTSYSTHTSWASGGYGPARGPVDHLGGGHLVAPSYSTRTVDSLGGGHLLRETGGHGSYSQGSTAKDTRRVDSLGGGHLLRETSVQSALPAQPATETLSVSQMPGYRKEAPTEDATYAGAAGTSKYYSTFQSSSSYGGGAVADGGLQQQTVQPSGPAVPDSASAASSADGRVTSSSYRKVVSYSSSVGERDLDHHSVVRDLPQPASGDVQRTLATNQAFIHAEQQGGSRIPEAASGSYFSSAHQRAVSGSHNEGLGVVVPARGTTASSSGRAEWASAQETRDSEYPPLSSPHGPATSSGSSQGSYSSTHNSYAGGSSLQSAAAGPSPDAAPNRGGKLSVSLMDIGILPSSHQQQQQVGSAYGNRYSSSSYGSNYSSRQVESSSPVTGYSSSWGSSSYSQQAPAKVSAYSASHGVARDQRVTQGHAGPDCDQGIKI